MIKPLGFNLDEKPLRRAGLDYHDLANVAMHDSYDDFITSIGDARVFAITTKGTRSYHEVDYQAGDVLLFGSETAGLTQAIFDSLPNEQWLRVPMIENNRSLNLSNTVALVSYEAWRQHDFSAGS